MTTTTTKRGGALQRGQTLRDLLAVRGLTVTQFAASVAVSHALARNWLDGLRVKNHHRAAVCGALNITDGDLTAAQIATVSQ
jgi:hypothetical protein